VVAELPTPVVLDHFGALKTASLANYDQSKTTGFDVLQQPGLDAITTLLRSGKLWIKLSAPYRCSEAGPEYLDMEPLVKALVQAHPDRVLYGSDWPHTQPFHRRPKNLEPTDIEPFVDFDDYTWVKTLKTWLSEEEWQKLMVKNPRVLMQYERND
jgi:predicted TIM-barrel fold metal-dependent hydrolase